ncbi:MAG: ABC transporter ATP-binding protein [Candidatus Omnitrophota bacterium]|jgi:lipoprotein-releasing system ATP-binding protein
MMLEAKNLHKFYNNGKKTLEVLRGVELKVETGRFIAIVGPSGAGKSTLLHILGGLDCPSQGKVIFEKEDIYALDDAAISHLRNKEIGFVFQFYNLLSEFTVLENILMPAEIAGSASYEAACKLLDKVGLKDRAGHFPNQLSGGEKQRVAIARGLINNPRLLLCDEPTGNLDSKTGEGIISLIKNINLENSMSVIMVTHNVELTKQANAVYQLKDGMLLN